LLEVLVESNRIQSLTLVAAVIGAAVLGSQSLGIGFGAAAVGDVAILLALFAFDEPAARSGAQSLGFAGVVGFCILTPLLFLANTVLGAEAGKSPWLIFGLWLIATLIMLSVDRFRMSSRDNVSLASSGLAGSAPIMAAAPAPTYRPAPIRLEPTPVPVQPPAPPPIYAAPPTPAPAPVATVQTPAVILNSAPDFAATTISAPVAAPAPVVPQPDVTAIPPGREALIYLNLVGEGLNVLRTVRAENLGRDYYRIADVMPEGEQWEFTPGQVVRCRKKSLSNGKHMVAYEEAPRAQ
jgi:hypothetical protein